MLSTRIDNNPKTERVIKNRERTRKLWLSAVIIKISFLSVSFSGAGRSPTVK